MRHNYHKIKSDCTELHWTLVKTTLELSHRHSEEILKYSAFIIVCRTVKMDNADKSLYR